MSDDKYMATDPADQALEQFLLRVGEGHAAASGERTRARRAQLQDRMRQALAEPAERKSAEVVAVPARPAPARRWLVAGGWVAAAAALVALVSVPVVRHQMAKAPLGAIEYQVAKGSGPSHVSIRRGSRIEATAGTILTMDQQRVNIALREGAELEVVSADVVRLNHGEAWTHVRTDSGYFEVQTPHGKVEVHGTTFGVIVDETGTRAVVADGKVEVGIGSKCEWMHPGTCAQITPGAEMPDFMAIEGSVTPDWVPPLLEEARAAHLRRYLPTGDPAKVTP